MTLRIFLWKNLNSNVGKTIDPNSECRFAKLRFAEGESTFSMYFLTKLPQIPTRGFSTNQFFVKTSFYEFWKFKGGISVLSENWTDEILVFFIWPKSPIQLSLPPCNINQLHCQVSNRLFQATEWKSHQGFYHSNSGSSHYQRMIQIEFRDGSQTEQSSSCCSLLSWWVGSKEERNAAEASGSNNAHFSLRFDFALESCLPCCFCISIIQPKCYFGDSIFQIRLHSQTKRNDGNLSVYWRSASARGWLDHIRNEAR
jgi:hypothetical protein